MAAGRKKSHCLKFVVSNTSSNTCFPIYPSTFRPTYLPNELPVYLDLPPSAYFFVQNKTFLPYLSANSTPFNLQSGPREAQWKSYDLPLLFLTPERPYLDLFQPFSFLPFALACRSSAVCAAPSWPSCWPSPPRAGRARGAPPPRRRPEGHRTLCPTPAPPVLEGR